MFVFRITIARSDGLRKGVMWGSSPHCKHTAHTLLIFITIYLLLKYYLLSYLLAYLLSYLLPYVILAYLLSYLLSYLLLHTLNTPTYYLFTTEYNLIIYYTNNGRDGVPSDIVLDPRKHWSCLRDVTAVTGRSSLRPRRALVSRMEPLVQPSRYTAPRPGFR